MNPVLHLIRHFSIRLRMIGAIAMVLALLLAVGGTGLWGMFRVQAESRQMADDAVNGLGALATLTQAAGDLRRYEKDLVINADKPEKVTEYLAKWRKAAKDTDANAGVIAQTWDGEVGDLARAARGQYAAYVTAAEAVFTKQQAGGYENVAAINEALAATAKTPIHAAEQSLSGIARAVSTASAATSRRVEASSQQALLLFSVVLGVAVLIVMPLTLANSASITRPSSSVW